MMTAAFAGELDGNVSSAVPVVLAGIRVSDIADFMPPCQLEPTNSPAIDMVNSCVDGGCEGQTHGELVLAWGEPERCKKSDRSTSVICRWSDKTSLLRPVGALQSTDIVQTVWAKEGNPGRTAEGFGVGVSIGCFLTAFGDSVRSVDSTVLNGLLVLDQVAFRNPGMIVGVDKYGYVDGIQL